jgi:molybdopterin-guanine dinucleotide biosynthesis protein A
MIILCGGKSTRLGTDKALLPFGDYCLIEYLVKKFQPLFPTIYLSVQQKGDYSHLDLPVTEIQDMYLNAGPLGGIFSSLSMIREEKAFVLSIDTPFVKPELAAEMLRRSEGSDICIIKRKTDCYDGFCGVYSKDCILSIGKSLLLKQLSVTSLTEKCKTAYIHEEEIAEICHCSFHNLFFSISNRTSYYKALQRLFANDAKAFDEEVCMDIPTKKASDDSDLSAAAKEATVLQKIPMLKNLF